MHGVAHSSTSSSILRLNSFPFLFSKSSSGALICRLGYGQICRLGYGHYVEHPLRQAESLLYSYSSDYKCREKKMGRLRGTQVKSSGRESPYQVLGVSPSASTKDIKRAYRRLALKYHPDVNKEVGAQEKFMRIKQAYNTLLNSKSRGKYDARHQESDYSYSTSGGYLKTQESEEEFYGLEDFFRDLQEEFRNWEATASQGKPKSLWEELAEIGEEFVEFLEKELNITDQEVVENIDGNPSKKTVNDADEKKTDQPSSIDDSINEIEAALAQLKKELGL